MRTSFNMLSTNSLNKNEEEETNIINKNATKTDNKHQQPTQQAPRAPRDRKAYLNDYYEWNKEIKEQIKKNGKEKTYKIRLLRELNNGLMNIDSVRKSILEKYNIKFDEKKK